MAKQHISSIMCLMYMVECGFADFSFPTTMEAWVAGNGKGYDSHYKTPALGNLHTRFQDLPTACEVVVEVYGSSVNPADTYSTSGVAGSDISGKVVLLGKACGSQNRLQIGTSVWGDIGANVKTASGQKTKENGAYAQYALALDTQLGIKPRNIGFKEAGVLPKVALTSYKALHWYANAGNWTSGVTAKGPVVLILGGSGGTGSTGLQLAKAFGGSHIITTTSAPNAAYCRSLGADRIIDYKSTNWWEALPEGSVDIVYDTVGQEGTGDRALRVLRASPLYGYYVTIAGSLPTGSKPSIESHMFINSDTNLDNLALWTDLNRFVEADQLRMRRIDSMFGLQQVSEAWARSASHKAVGKIAITVTNSSQLTSG